MNSSNPDHQYDRSLPPRPVAPLLRILSSVFEWQSATGRTYNIYYATELHHHTTVWTLLDQLPGTGGIISHTNPWPDPVSFYFLDLSVSAGP